MVTGPSNVTVRLLTVDRWADPSFTVTLPIFAGAMVCTGELPSSGARSGTAALFPMTALFRGHRLYVHCSGERVAMGIIRLRGTLAVNSLPLMVMSPGLRGVITPAMTLLNRPVPSGLTRTTESHRTF